MVAQIRKSPSLGESLPRRVRYAPMPPTERRMSCGPTTPWVGIVLSGVVAFLGAAYVAMPRSSVDGPHSSADNTVSRSTGPTLSTDALQAAPSPHMTAEQRVLPGSPETSIDLRPSASPAATQRHWSLRRQRTSR